MTIINEIPIIPFWQAGVAVIITFCGIIGAAILAIKISQDGITIGSTLAIFLSAIVCILGVAWISFHINYKASHNLSRDVARYEIVIDDNKVSSDTLKKIQKNYEIIESEKIGYMTKASIEGPRYKTVFSENEITIDYQ